MSGLARQCNEWRQPASRAEAKKLVCSKCGGEHTRKGQRYCKACHAENMREWRKSRPTSEEACARYRACVFWADRIMRRINA